MMSRLGVVALVALGATGCFATKGDMRLLQEELRATRASLARSDSAHRRTSDSLSAALANLASVQTLAARDALAAHQKTSDELKALATRVSNNDIATKEQLKGLNDDVDQLREITRQNARSRAAVQAQIEQATRSANPAAPTTTDSTAAAAPSTPVPTVPGAATMLVTGRSLVIQGSCSTARRTFQDLLNQYPDSPDAPEALMSIAESYVQCTEGGNPAKADSVYQLVIERYPRSDFAATSLYKRAEALRQANKMSEARPLYERIVCQYPKSTVLPQARSRLGTTQPTCR